MRLHGITRPETFIKREIWFDCDEIPTEYAFCIPVMAKFTGPLAKRGLTVYHTLRTFTIAIEREAAGDGHVKSWADLYAKDKHIIDEALAKR